MSALFPRPPTSLDSNETLSPAQMVDRAYEWKAWADTQKLWAITFAFYTVAGIWVFVGAPISGTVSCIATTFGLVVAVNLSHRGNEHFLRWMYYAEVRRH